MKNVLIFNVYYYYFFFEGKLNVVLIEKVDVFF